MNVTRVADILSKNEASILKEWIDQQIGMIGQKANSADLAGQCGNFIRGFTQAMQSADAENLGGAAWKPLKEILTVISKSRAQQGYSPAETAVFIFSLKKPVLNSLRVTFENDVRGFADEMMRVDSALDGLGLFTMDVYARVREEVIARQQEEMLELSTPVVKLWDGILGLPMIGTLDSSRTQVVMETLLQKIVDTGSEVAIIDITGVPTVDTLVAQHLMKTVTAARLMGAECIISGIRPQIAATIVHLGVDLGNIVTKATLADAFAVALTRIGRSVQRISTPPVAAKETRQTGQFPREVRA